MKPAFKHSFIAVGLFLMAVCTATWAADLDADALALQPDLTPDDVQAPTKLFLEAAVGLANQRYGLGSRTISRASVDVRHTSRLATDVQGTLSARVDATDPPDPQIDGAVLSLREFYLGWQDGASANVVELGRINLREGPGYGYNPTDFFRDNALRTITTVDPFTLRENRLGSVMLRGQRLWPGVSMAAAYSPKLAAAPSDEGFSADLGATNARDRGVVSLNSRHTETLNTQLLTYKEAGASPTVGASLTALVSQAAVAHIEGSYGSEQDLLSRALGLPTGPDSRSRLAAGFTYTTQTRLSLTAEYQYNGFALDHAGWQALAAADPAALAAYFRKSLALQDNAARQAWLLYAVQRDLGLKNLDLTAFVKFNRTDSSRLLWLDLRYRLEKMDLALRGQRSTGVSGSEFGSLPISGSTSVVATLYF